MLNVRYIIDTPIPSQLSLQLTTSTNVGILHMHCLLQETITEPAAKQLPPQAESLLERHITCTNLVFTTCVIYKSA